MNTPPAPGVTLLVPCFNAARFLPQLQLNLADVKPGFAQIIFYDDGSVDETAKLLAKWPGATLLRGETNRGVAHARNRLAEAARTEWIHFHDADDLIAPSFLAELQADCTTSFDVVSCDADWLDAADRKLLLTWRYDRKELERNPAPYLLGHPMSLNNTLIRRSLWTKIGGCDESLKMWEDADVHYRLAVAGSRWRHHPKVLTQALRREESFSHDYRQSWQHRLAALKRYAETEGGRRWPLAIGVESEKAARALLDLGAFAAARDAVKLCQKLGHAVPQSRHFAMKCLRAILPAWWLLRLQTRLRAPSAKKPMPARPPTS